MEDSLEDNVNFYSLEVALLNARCIGTHYIIVFGGISLGIYLENSNFYVFDSHFRDKYVMSCSNGQCVLGYVKNIDQLCTHLRLLSGCGNHMVQFDLHVLTFSTRYRYTPFTVQILDDRLRLNLKPRKIRNKRKMACEHETEISKAKMRRTEKFSVADKDNIPTENLSGTDIDNIQTENLSGADIDNIQT